MSRKDMTIAISSNTKAIRLFHKKGEGWFWNVSGSRRGIAYEDPAHGPFPALREAKLDALKRNVEEITDYIESQLTRNDCVAWHNGQLTNNTRRMVVQFPGELQVWGMAAARDGEEPLSVVYHPS